MPEPDTLQAALEAIASGQNRDPFAVLGCHRDAGRWVVRSFQPQASAVSLVDGDGKVVAPMRRIHPAGIFAGAISGHSQRYVLHVDEGSRRYDLEDPYRFPSPLGELDLHLIGEGTHR